MPTYTCRYCGKPTTVESEEQTPPSDYCGEHLVVDERVTPYIERTNLALRDAIVLLRLDEFNAAKYLPDKQMKALTAHLDALVAALRKTGALT